jgi:hypothetical protein
MFPYPVCGFLPQTTICPMDHSSPYGPGSHDHDTFAPGASFKHESSFASRQEKFPVLTANSEFNFGNLASSKFPSCGSNSLPNNKLLQLFITNLGSSATTSSASSASSASRRRTTIPLQHPFTAIRRAPTSLEPLLLRIYFDNRQYESSLSQDWLCIQPECTQRFYRLKDFTSCYEGY